VKFHRERELKDLYLKSFLCVSEVQGRLGWIVLFSDEEGRTIYYLCRGILCGGFLLNVFDSRAK